MKYSDLNFCWNRSSRTYFARAICRRANQPKMSPGMSCSNGSDHIDTSARLDFVYTFREYLPTDFERYRSNKSCTRAVKTKMVGLELVMFRSPRSGIWSIRAGESVKGSCRVRLRSLNAAISLQNPHDAFTVFITDLLQGDLSWICPGCHRSGISSI